MQIQHCIQFKQGPGRNRFKLCKEKKGKLKKKVILIGSLAAGREHKSLMFDFIMVGDARMKQSSDKTGRTFSWKNEKMSV